ncbi:MAG: protein kinase [Planctomycetota bacterium]|nr:protein kinase [Planctomycetota bacterium]
MRTWTVKDTRGMKLVCPTCHSRFDKPTTLTGAPILCPMCGHAVPEPEKISSSDRPAVDAGWVPREARAGTLLPVQPASSAHIAPATGIMTPPDDRPRPDPNAGDRDSSIPAEGGGEFEEIGQVQGIPTPAPARSSSGGDLKPGDILGGCEIVEKIASGGMGTVYRARHLRLDREVALKVLPEELASKGGPNVRLRFFNEAQVAAQIDHPNVVQVFDVGQEHGRFYIIFQYVTGMTLERLVGTRGPMDCSEALQVILRAADGLLAAHKKGLVHRDVKPSNIMLSEDGRVKITDFGLARFEDISCELNTFGHILGTPLYMSPEQCDGRDMDIRSDIYSLGCTLYYLLTGTPPFVADNTLAIMRMHREAMPRPAHEVNPKVPPEVWPLVERTMAKRSEDRYPSLVEFMADVEDVLAGRPPGYATAWRPVTAPPPVPEPILPLPERLPAQAHSSGILGGRRAAMIPIPGGESRRRVGGTLLRRAAFQPPVEMSVVPGKAPDIPAEPPAARAAAGGSLYAAPSDAAAGSVPEPTPRPVPQENVADTRGGIGEGPGIPAPLPASALPPAPVTVPPHGQPAGPAGPELPRVAGGKIAGNVTGRKDPATSPDPMPAIPRPSTTTTFRKSSGPLIGWGVPIAPARETAAGNAGKDRTVPTPGTVARGTPVAGTSMPEAPAARTVAPAPRRTEKVEGYNPWTVERDSYAERIARKRQALAGKVFDTKCSRCGHVFEVPGSKAYSSRECPNCGTLTICEPIESKDGERGSVDDGWKKYSLKVVKVCVFLLTAIGFAVLAYLAYWLAYGRAEDAAASLRKTVDRYYNLLSLRDYRAMYRIESAGADAIVPEARYIEHMKKTYSLIEVKGPIIEPPVLSDDGKSAKVRVRLRLEGTLATDMKSAFVTSWIRRGDAWLKLPSRSLCQSLGIPPPSRLDPDSE